MSTPLDQVIKLSADRVLNEEEIQGFLHSNKNRIWGNGLFLVSFKKIPSCQFLSFNFPLKELDEFITTTFQQHIIAVYKNVEFTHFGEEKPTQRIYLLRNEIVITVNFEIGATEILYNSDENELVKILKVKGAELMRNNTGNKLSVAVPSDYSNEINLKFLELKKPKFNLQNNYNDDFQAIHKRILSRLKRTNDKGIILLHGEPGTGKSYYLRYLSSLLKKQVIFIPPVMIESFNGVTFFEFLFRHPNTVIVIEDAETLMFDREEFEQSPVSVLLNITDGLLSDGLNIQVICTFNTALDRIDPALMRKGRLIARYEFGPLAPEKATALSKKLGFNQTYTEPVKLSDIYNEQELTFEQNKRKTIKGFRK